MNGSTMEVEFASRSTVNLVVKVQTKFREELRVIHELYVRVYESNHPVLQKKLDFHLQRLYMIDKLQKSAFQQLRVEVNQYKLTHPDFDVSQVSRRLGFSDGLNHVNDTLPKVPFPQDWVPVNHHNPQQNAVANGCTAKINPEKVQDSNTIQTPATVQAPKQVPNSGTVKSAENVPNPETVEKSTQNVDDTEQMQIDQEESTCNENQLKGEENIVANGNAASPSYSSSQSEASSSSSGTRTIVKCVKCNSPVNSNSDDELLSSQENWLGFFGLISKEKWDNMGKEPKRRVLLRKRKSTTKVEYVYQEKNKSVKKTQQQPAGVQKTKGRGKGGKKSKDDISIPSLPSDLTIEKIESDENICVSCRNPGTLATCEYCAAKFHVSCHTTQPASWFYCPKCATRFQSKGLTASDLEILRLEMNSVKIEKETEEREKVRYELRERNADLRLQVSDLEKRSQLISQSLQLQRHTRRELFAKQEKTQKSIKRLVDFIKLMQLKPDPGLPPPPSSDCQPPLASYPSPPDPPPPYPSSRMSESPSLPSTSRSTTPLPPATWDHQQPRDSASIPLNNSSSPQSSSVSSRSRASPPSTASQGRFFRTSRRLANRYSLSRRSPDKDDGKWTEIPTKRNQKCQSLNGQVDVIISTQDNPGLEMPVPKTTSPSKSSATTIKNLSSSMKVQSTLSTSLKTPWKDTRVSNSSPLEPMKLRIKSPKCLTYLPEVQKPTSLNHPSQQQQQSPSAPSPPIPQQALPVPSAIRTTESMATEPTTTVATASTTVISLTPSSPDLMGTKSRSSMTTYLPPLAQIRQTDSPMMKSQDT